MNTQKITKNELIQILSNIEKFKFVGVTIKTNPTDIRKFSNDKELNPYYNQIEKVTSNVYLLCCNYKKRKKKELDKLGIQYNDNEIIEYSNRVNGLRLKKNSPLLYNSEQNQYYLMLEYFLKVKNKKTFYQTKNGEKLSKEFIKKFKSEKSNENTELVKVILPKIENIIKITLNKITYEII